MIDNERLDHLIPLAAHDDEAFTLLYRECHRSLFMYAYGILADHALAEDAVSECFIRLRRAADTYEPKGKGRAFLWRICEHAAYELLRQQKRAVITGDPPEQAVAAADESHVFCQSLLGKLSLEQRQVLILRYYEDLTFAEIAQTLGITESTVKWRHANALKRCRKLL